jgi:hypothetical protein
VTVHLGKVSHTDYFLIIDALHHLYMEEMLPDITADQRARANKLATHLLGKNG